MKTIKKVTLVQESISPRKPRIRRINEERTTGAERSLENSWLKDFRSTGFHKIRLTKDEEYELLNFDGNFNWCYDKYPWFGCRYTNV